MNTLYLALIVAVAGCKARTGATVDEGDAPAASAALLGRVEADLVACSQHLALDLPVRDPAEEPAAAGAGLSPAEMVQELGSALGQLQTVVDAAAPAQTAERQRLSDLIVDLAQLKDQAPALPPAHTKRATDAVKAAVDVARAAVKKGR